MIVGPPLRKEPTEIIPWTVDVARIFAPGETLLAVPTFKAYQMPAKTDVTITMAQDPPVEDGTLWTQMIKGGASDVVYWLELAFVTTYGQKREAAVKLYVKAIP